MNLSKKRSLTAFFLLIFSIVSAQEKFTLSGTVTDSNSNETLIGASVFIKEAQASVSTNEYGFFSISLPEGTYTVEISYVSFGTITETVTLNQNIRKTYGLNSATQELEEVIITDDKPRINIKKPEMSVNKLTTQEI